MLTETLPHTLQFAALLNGVQLCLDEGSEANYVL